MPGQSVALTSPLRRRRVLKYAGWLLVSGIVISAGLDRAGAFGYRGDDVRRFDQRAAAVTSILDSDTFQAKVDDADVTVGLIGVIAPKSDEHWSDRARRYLTARLSGRTVTLKLEQTQTRDARRRLLAYVYITDADLLNQDMLHDGQAYVDRRGRCSLQTQLEQAENEARKKRRGLWQDLTDQTMPEWRRAWLRDWQKDHSR